MLSILLRQSTPPRQRLQDEAYPTPGSYNPPNAATADEPGQTKEENDVPLLAQPQNWCSRPAARWGALLAFSLNSACNAMMFMNFASVAALSKETLGHVGNKDIEWLYTASLLVVMPLTPVAACLLERHDVAVGLAGVGCNVLGAWLRWVSVQVQLHRLLHHSHCSTITPTAPSAPLSCSGRATAPRSSRASPLASAPP